MPYITDAAKEYAKKRAKDSNVQNKDDFLVQIKNLSPYEKYKALVKEIEKVDNDEYLNTIYDKNGNELSAYDEYGDVIVDLITLLIRKIESKASSDNERRVIVDNLRKIANDYFTKSNKILSGPISGIIDELFEKHNIDANNSQHTKNALPQTKGDAYERYDCLDIYDIHKAYYGNEPRGIEYEDMDADDIAFEKEFMIGELFNSGEIDKLEKLLPVKDSCTKDDDNADVVESFINMIDAFDKLHHNELVKLFKQHDVDEFTGPTVGSKVLEEYAKIIKGE